VKLGPREGRLILGITLALGLLGLLIAIRPLRELKIRVNDLDFLPAGSPVLAADQIIRERFGSDERLIIAFEGVKRGLSDPEYRKDLGFFLAQLAQSQNKIGRAHV